MKIDREKMEALCAMPDEQLWREVQRIAASYGFKLPDKVPSKEEMQKMRDAVSGTKINLGEALKIIKNYKGDKR